jgi:hypothetical protein
MNSRLRSPATLISAIAIITLVYCLITFNAFPGDSLMYHLAFAARFWQLPGWPDYSGYFEPRYQGFPILWRVLMLPGLVSKEPRLLFLPNLLAMYLLCWSARKYLALSWSLCIVACLCFPVVLFGFASSMQDFFVGATALAGAIAVFAASLLPSAGESKRAWLAGLLFLGLCANVKYQGLILAVVILFLSLSFALIARISDPSQRYLPRWKTVKLWRPYPIVILLLISLLLFQPAVNLYRFKNPLYPNNAFLFKGPEPTGVSTIPYIPKLPLVYNGLTFASSALEIDPILRSSRRFLFQRSVHMQNPPDSGAQPADLFGNRWIITGGSYGFLFLLLFLLAFLSVTRPLKQRDHGLMLEAPAGNSIRSLQNRLMISFLVAIFLPQTMELRYYMYNLLVPSVVALSSPWPDLRRPARWLAALTVFGTVVLSFLLPMYFWVRTHNWLHERISWDPFFEVPTQQQCKRVDKEISGLNGERDLGIGSVKQSVLCHFKR